MRSTSEFKVKRKLHSNFRLSNQQNKIDAILWEITAGSAGKGKDFYLNNDIAQQLESIEVKNYYVVQPTTPYDDAAADVVVHTQESDP